MLSTVACGVLKRANTEMDNCPFLRFCLVWQNEAKVEKTQPLRQVSNPSTAAGLEVKEYSVLDVKGFVPQMTKLQTSNTEMRIKRLGEASLGKD